jgi:geranylgeranyl diphosphate synthase type II
MIDFDRYLTEQVRAVDRFLSNHLPPEDAYPESIHRAMRYSLFAGGKRLRPVLTLAAAEAVGGRAEDVMPAAAALELVHTYSLIHDDLPAMDDDSLRRGKPTSHVVFGEAIAILAGDALLTEAFHMLSSKTTGDAERKLRAVVLLSNAAGVRGMVGGQVVDVESEGLPVGEDVLDYIHQHKTGALIRTSVEIGALLGGGSEEDIERLSHYGKNVGLAFQIVDDILDVEGDADSLGKTAGKDEKAGKATYPKIHGIEKARERARELCEQAVSLVEPYSSAGEPLESLARRIVSRNS